MKTHFFQVEYKATANLTSAELNNAQALIKAITDTCDVVTTAPMNKDLNWSCASAASELVIPKQACLESVYVALHECGHFTHGHQYGNYTSRLDEQYNIDQLRFENEANEFALAQFKTITSNPEAITTIEKLIAKQIGCYEEQVKERQEMAAAMAKEGTSTQESFEKMMEESMAEHMKAERKHARKENIKTMILSALAGVGAAHVVFSVLTAIL